MRRAEFFFFFFPKLAAKHRNMLQAGPRFIHDPLGLLSRGQSLQEEGWGTLARRGCLAATRRWALTLLRETTGETTASKRNLQRLSQREGSKAKSMDEQHRPEALEMFGPLGHLCSCGATSAPRASSVGMSSPANPTRHPSPLPQPWNAAGGHLLCWDAAWE